MARRTSVLRHEFDRRLFALIRARIQIESPDRHLILGDYAREAHRQGWTWRLTAEAMQASETTVRRWAEAVRAAAMSHSRPNQREGNSNGH